MRSFMLDSFIDELLSSKWTGVVKMVRNSSKFVMPSFNAYKMHSQQMRRELKESSGMDEWRSFRAVKQMWLMFIVLRVLSNGDMYFFTEFEVKKLITFEFT